MLTIQDKKLKTQQKRSQAIMSKINILWSRDGHDVPEIESQKEIDIFNLKQLFGESGSADINFTNMGVEGLIRCYYHISYLLKGIKRNNIIINSNETIPSYCSTSRSKLETAADWVMSGNPQYASYFVGWKKGEQGNTPPYNEAPSDELINNARKGIFDLEDTVFLCNRDYIDSDGHFPANSTNNLYNKIQNIIDLIGSNSSLGQKIFSSIPTLSQLIHEDEILGLRNTDVYPHSVIPEYEDPPGTINPAQYIYGNGIWDSLGENISTPEFHPNPNIWLQEWTDALNELKDEIDEVISYINYTKITGTPDYLINTAVIPGRDTNFVMQDEWITYLTEIQSAIDAFFIVLGTDDKEDIDTALNELKSSLTSGLNNVNTINDTINAGGSITTKDYGKDFFGDPDDKGETLWGLRAQWIKSIMDIQDGSKIILESLDSVITMMNGNITKAEDQFGLFGIGKDFVSWTTAEAWIDGLVIPEISGIDEHSIVDTDINSDTFGELMPDGYIIAWEATAHTTGYDIWRSYDWDGATGTWLKLLPAGNTFSIENINPANGQTYNYYTDTDVNLESETKPFYKVKAYDTGGEGDYSRIPAESEECEPKNILDFQGQGGEIPSQLPPGQGGNEEEDELSTYWKDPVLSYTNLPTSENDDGDVRLVINEGSLYYWDADNNLWKNMIYQSVDDTWKSPIETKALLPTINNQDGDVRLVRDENVLYRWDGESWIVLSGGTSNNDLSHDDLNDMPDNSGINADHDSRYYTQNEIDQHMEEVQSQIDLLKYLIPSDAAPLAGLFELDSSNEYKTAYLSNGYSTQQRFHTLMPYTEYSKIIKGGEITLLNPDPEHQFNNADKGNLTLIINDIEVDSFNLLASFNESERMTQQTYPPQYSSGGLIEITEVKPYNNYGQYQKGNYKIHLNSSVLENGENNIRLEHSFGSSYQTTAELVLFYDSSIDVITFTSMNIQEKNIYSAKYLSGVRYYAVGDKLTLTLEAQKLFNNTYLFPNQIFVDGSELGIGSYWINHESAGSTFIDFGTPTIDARLRNVKDVTITTQNIYNVEPHFTVKGYNLTESSEYSSPDKDILINTYPRSSDNKNEFFVDEYYRLPAGEYTIVPHDYYGLWASNFILNMGELLTYEKSIQYPNINLLNYLPIQSINYTGYTDIRTYYRAFIDPGKPHTNGTFLIDNWLISDPNITIYIKLPGLTGWLDLSKNYNQVEFNGTTGDGCLIENNEYSYQWTSGIYSTAFSGYMVIMKITMTNGCIKPIKQISINW